MEASDAFMRQRTVHTWLAHLQRQTQLTPPEHQESLHILAAFCAYVGQAPDAIITACFRATPEGQKIHSRNRQHYAAQIDAFQRQVAGDRRQQVQYGRIVRSFLIHNGIMLQTGWQYRPQREQA